MSTTFITSSASDSDASLVSSWNRGPLTTTFTPPISCLAQTTLTVDNEGNSLLFQGHYGWGDHACYPPQTAATPNWSAWGDYYYSPGICPQGWTSACSQTTSQAGLTTTLPAETHAAVCCPTGYTCVAHGHECATDVALNSVLTKVWSVDQGAEGNDNDGYSTTLHSLISLTITSGTQVSADGIPIFWRDVDTVLFPASKTTSAVAKTSASSSFTSSPTSSSTSTPPVSTGLSTGAVIAVAVVIPVIVIAALLGIFFWIRKRKQRQIRSADRERLAGDFDQVEMDGNNWGKPRLSSRKGGMSPVEVGADHAIVSELDTLTPYANQGLPQELPLTAAHSTSSRAVSPYRPRPPLVSKASATNSPASMPLLSARENSPDRDQGFADSGPRSTTQTTMQEKEAKLARLRADIERVRAEKEQVKTLNELETMEEQLKQEILKQQKDTMGF